MNFRRPRANHYRQKYINYQITNSADQPLTVNASTFGKNCRLQRSGTPIVSDDTEQWENTEWNQWIYSGVVTEHFELG